jgi:hypothetical protein
VIHGGVRTINRFVFASQRAELAEELAWAGTDVVISGHCGLPFMQKIGIGKVGHSIWFNPGVDRHAGQRRDARRLVWADHARRMAVVLSTHRLAYDHLAAAAAMRRYGHANGYARSLITGLWPSLDVLPPPEHAATGKKIRPRSLSIPARSRSRPLNRLRSSVRPLPASSTSRLAPEGGEEDGGKVFHLRWRQIRQRWPHRPGGSPMIFMPALTMLTA